VERTPSCHRQMTGGFTHLEEVFIKILLISEQQSIATISRKLGKCEYIKYSASVENNDLLHTMN
jgi:hypothetical protein